MRTCSLRTFFGLFGSLRYMHTSCDHLTQLLATRLQACPDSALLRQARQVHAQLLVNADTLLSANILGIYVLCGSFSDAARIFFNLELGCSVPWNFMIRGLVKVGCFQLALLYYFKMLARGVCPDRYTFPSVVKACSALDNVGAVKSIHDTILSSGLEVDAFVASSLIKLYGEAGQINDARKVFDNISQKDCVLWNVMLNGYAKSEASDDVIRAFKEMKKSEIKPNSITFACVLSVCATESMIELASQLHGLVIGFGLEFDPSVENTLLAVYSKCSRLSDACKLFSLMPETDLVTWNCMITGYVQNGFMEEALDLFRDMISSNVSPDPITFSSLLPSIIELGSLKQIKEIHGYTLRQSVPMDVFLISALIDAYFKFWNVEMAQNVFSQCTTVDVAVCTAMISGYMFNSMNIAAIKAFRRLLKEKMGPNDITLASVLPACSGLVAVKLGKELHAQILKKALNERCHVGCALMDMYAKCGRTDLAHHIFRRMSWRDTVSWNSMITNLAQNGKPEQAIDVFRQMRMSGATYDCVSISAALSACASLPAQNYGKEIHCLMIKGIFDSDVLAESALIDMYAKSGNLDSASCVFEVMKDKNEVSWNSIIAAYGNHGCLKDTLDLYHKMLEDGVQPDHITFLAMISACSHVGAVDEGIRTFSSMTKEYGIPAQMEHYACMVDLFGRAGRLNEAFELIKSMPFQPDAGIWGTLLGACRLHGNVELARMASRNLLELDPRNSGYYVLLSNIHANVGEWGNVLKIRSLMKERGVHKTPGYSWIDVSGCTHVFIAADGSHPESAQLYSLLKLLLIELKKEGYVPQLHLPLHPQALGTYHHIPK